MVPAPFPAGKTSGPSGIGLVSKRGIEYDNQCNLSGSVSNGVLAFWDALITRASGVCVATVGSAPNRQFIATWNDVALPALAEATHLTFSVVLSESTDTIDVLYASTFDFPEAQGSSASIGLASPTAFALECGNTACVTNFSGKRYTPR